jgi:glycosyltransferase involved in cell wall biosynthesis
MESSRVAIQLVSTGGVYGAERALLELAGYLGDHGWESHVVALEGRGAGELTERAASRGLAAEAFVSAGRLGLLPMVVRLRSLLRRHPRAIVHSHGYKPDILLAWLGAPGRVGCLATCHNWISDTRKLQLLEALDKHALRQFHHVVAVSPAIADELMSSGVPADRVSVVDNGVSIPQAEEGARARVRAEFDIPAGARLILHIGRLARSKRIDLLLQAVARLPDAMQAQVILAGEGDQHAFLSEQVGRHRLERRVHLCGYRSDVGRLLTAADLMVLSSEREGLPIVILEAMATRCPIVTTCVGSIPSVLTDGLDAWVVRPNDADALLGAISDALEHPDLAISRAANAYTRYLRLYSRDAMGARYLQIYEDVWTRRQPKIR